ncbi:MAG: DNA polymerase I [Propionibacteriaceae bacterium]|jgi:DNA polymerase-1|nr:DNA polymerase I [Propionibacteriaceae bacterium]
MLVDGHSVAFRAFYGLPVDNFHTDSGRYTNATFGFFSMLTKLVKAEQPTHLAVAFDISRRSFRTAEYPEYKGTRAETPAPFIGQTDDIQAVLTALGVVNLTKEDYEADDIIATLATQGEKAGLKVLVVTGDRDTLQLVDESVTVLYPIRGVTELARLDPEAVEKRYLVPPKQYPELAALVGESSDNLPGVPGVGPKTAAKWLAQYETLDNLLLHAGEIGGKVGESLREHIEDVKRNRRLNALVCDLELPFSIADLRRKPGDREAVVKLFDELQIRALRNEVIAMMPAGSGSPVASPATPAALPKSEATAVDITGHWSEGAGDVTSITVLPPAGEAETIDPTELTPAAEAKLAAFLADPAQPKIVHDTNLAALLLSGRGWKLDGVQVDTLLAAYLLQPDQRLYEVKDLAIRYLGRELDGEAEAEGLLPGLSDDSGAALARAQALQELAVVLPDELPDEKSKKLLTRLEQPLAKLLAQLELTGVAVDADALAALSSSFDAQVQQAQAQAFEVLGHEVNLASPKQLQAVLFDELGMPKTRKTATGHTTNAEALAELYAQTGHPFLEALLTHRDQIKLRQIVDGLAAAIAPDGRIHTTYSQVQAATGRLASAEPNLQNIPVRSEAGRQIRQAFVAGPGYAELMTADYSQIEMRIMAHLSGDKALIDAFNSGADFHASMAAHVFGIPAADVTPTQRARIKAMNYGLAYGLSSFGLSQQLGISVPEAKQLMDVYFGRFGHVRDYLQSLVAQATQRGYTETIFGRRRYLPELTSTVRQRREIAERMALNSPIQGSAADIIKKAMLDTQAAIDKAGLNSRMLLQVHDELIFEVAPGESDRLEDLVRHTMGNAIHLSVALDVSVGHGPTWDSAAH